MQAIRDAFDLEIDLYAVQNKERKRVMFNQDVSSSSSSPALPARCTPNCTGAVDASALLCTAQLCVSGCTPLHLLQGLLDYAKYREASPEQKVALLERGECPAGGSRVA